MNAVRRVVSRSCMVRLWPWYANAHNHLLLTLHSVYSVQQPFCIWIHLFFSNSIEKFHPLNLILIEMTVSIYLSLFFFLNCFSSLLFSFLFTIIILFIIVLATVNGRFHDGFFSLRSFAPKCFVENGEDGEISICPLNYYYRARAHKKQHFASLSFQVCLCRCVVYT